MADLHRALAIASVLGVVALAVAATWAVVNRHGARFLIDRLILAELVILAAAAMAGTASWLGGDGPADPLHFVYAVAALIALPLARGFAGQVRPDAARGQAGRRGGYVALGSLVLLGLIVRLFMTGG